jgi:Arc/MetJ-type ribon-helix-helix transcriptional regulator
MTTGPGRPKHLEGKLTNFNTKIMETDKATVDALVSTKAFSSKREFVEYAIRKFKEDYPEQYQKALQFIELTK